MTTLAATTRRLRWFPGPQSIVILLVSIQAFSACSESSSTGPRKSDPVPAKIAFRVAPTSSLPYAPITPPVEVVLLDADDNVVASATDGVTITIGENPGSASLSGTTTSAANGGVARFEDLVLDRSTDGYTLRASSGALSEITSQRFDIRFTFAMVRAGKFHSCGVTTRSAAYCWGANEISNTADEGGQLGDGTTVERHQPTRVLGDYEWTWIDGDAYHSCGVTKTGEGFCWGSNTLNGQLGDGTNSPSASPVAVAGGLKFRTIETGSYHSCALTTAYQVHCWGRGSLGRLGDGTETDRNFPAPVAGNLEFASLSAGNGYVCAVTLADVGYCWGSNSAGKLGMGSGDRSVNVPTKVFGLVKFRSVTTGSSHTCGVSINANSGLCWGQNALGQLGDGTTVASNRPVVVDGGLAFAMISPGSGHTCGVTAAGDAYCWGSNSAGQLGTGSTMASLSPVPVAGGLKFASVTSRAGHTCGLTTSALVYCWGLNLNGQLGNSTNVDNTVPVLLADPQ